MIDKVFWEIVPGECCNLKCVGCYAANNNRPDRRIIKEKDAITIVKKLLQLGTQKIDILGGEPLLCGFLEKIIREFKSVNQSGFVGVVSNGILLTNNRVIALKNSGLDQISVSLDGVTVATNDWSRGEGSFHKIIRGIKNAIAADLSVSISYTITKKNLFETAEFIPFAEKIGAKSIGVQITEKNGRAELN